MPDRASFGHGTLSVTGHMVSHDKNLDTLTFTQTVSKVERFNYHK